MSPVWIQHSDSRVGCECLQRESAGDPCDALVRIAGLERGADCCGRLVPTLAYRVAACVSLRIDLRGGRVVDSNGLALAAAENAAVAVAVQLAAGTCRGGLVGECEVRQDRGSVPPNAARRTFPVVTRAPIDNVARARRAATPARSRGHPRSQANGRDTRAPTDDAKRPGAACRQPRDADACWCRAT